MKLYYKIHSATEWIKSNKDPTQIIFNITNATDQLIEVLLLETQDSTLFSTVINLNLIDFKLEFSSSVLYTHTTLNNITHSPTKCTYMGQMTKENILLYSMEFINF